MGYNRNMVIERINQLKKENRARVKAGEPVQDLSTNQKLSEIFKVSEKTIRNWLNKNPKNKIEMSIEDLIKFSELFECDINYLLGNIDQKTQIKTDICKATGLNAGATNWLVEAEKIIKNRDFKNIYDSDLLIKKELLNDLITMDPTPLDSCADLVSIKHLIKEIENKPYFTYALDSYKKSKAEIDSKYNNMAPGNTLLKLSFYEKMSVYDDRAGWDPIDIVFLNIAFYVEHTKDDFIKRYEFDIYKDLMNFLNKY